MCIYVVELAQMSEGPPALCGTGFEITFWCDQFAAVLSDVEFIYLILFHFILAEVLAKNNTRRDKNAIYVYTVRYTQFTTKHKI